MNIFYVIIDNKETSYKTLKNALYIAHMNDNAMIYVEEYFDDIDRSSIRTLLYEKKEFIFQNIFEYFD